MCGLVVDPLPVKNKAQGWSLSNVQRNEDKETV